MSDGVKKVLLGVVAVAALGLMTWTLWSHGGGDDGGGDGDILLMGLCTECGHVAEVSQSELMAALPERYLPAMSPDDGPGYVCPKCDKQTFYTNPIHCPECDTYFVIRRDENGVQVMQCPKCGWSG